MSEVKITHGMSQQKHPRRCMALFVATLILGLATQTACAQQRSAFPASCAHLLALSRTTANGPEDELRFDTERIQAALNVCPVGEAVELEAAPQDAPQQNAFLTGPLQLPPGVTLLIDADVTLFGSRRQADYRQPNATDSAGLPCGDLPCRPLIEAEGESASAAAAVDGFGTLDGRGSQPLLDSASGTVFWSDFDPAQRPALIHSSGSFEVHKLTLRDAPATALSLSGRGMVTVQGTKFVASTLIPGTRGIVQASPDLTLVVSNSTLAQRSSAIETVAPGQLTMSSVEVHSGSQVANATAGAQTRCTSLPSTAAVCVPTALPLYAGELFLSTSTATNLLSASPSADLALHVVLSAAESGLPPATGPVTIYDGAHALVTATLRDGAATVKLRTLDPKLAHVLTARADSSVVSFGSAHATVQANLSTVALSASATHATYNTPVDLSASVNPNTATGTVSFYDGTSLLGQAALVSGTAAFTETQLTPGNHTLTAHYAGDSANSAADSLPLNLRIDQAQTASIFSGLPRTPVYGSVNQATVSVSPASATGSIALIDSFAYNGQTRQIALGSAAVNNGSAIVSLSNPGVGTHTLTATYSGDGNYLGSNAAATLVITSQPTLLTLSSPQATLVRGTSASFSVTLTPATATGTVTFSDSASGGLGQVAIANGQASLSTSALTVGMHSVSASYSGDANDSAAVSPSVSVTVDRTPSSLLLSALPSSLAAGSPITLAATLNPQAGTGIITFATLSGITLGQSSLTNGSATILTSSLPAGTYSLFASYGGDGVTAPSTSTAQTVQITSGASVSLSASPSSGAYGSSVALAADVTPGGATGFVTFSDATLGILGSAPLGNSRATLNLSNLAPGVHLLKAIYSGDSSHPSAMSAAVPVNITPANTSTLLTVAQNTISAGTPAVLNLQVNSQSPTSPTGTVVVRAGSRILTSGQLAAGVNGSSYLTVSIPSDTLGLGSFSLSASYGGDSLNAASATTANVSLTVVGTTTRTDLTVSQTQAVLNTAVVLTARVTTPANASTPSGAISLAEDGTVFATLPLAPDGSASTSFSPPHLGLHILSATYQPTGTFAASTAASFPLSVTLPVALVLAPAALAATANSTHAAALTITPLSGYSGPIQSSCSSPAYIITCTLNAPSSIQSTPLQATVQITIAKDLASNSSLIRPLPVSSTVALASLLPLMGLTRKRISKSLTLLQGARVLTVLAVALLLTGALSGCALGGNFFNIPPGPQSVTVSVVAAGTTVSTSMQVNITQ